MSDIATARRHLSSGQLDAAERAFEQVLEKSPDNAEALNMVALASLRAGRTARAIELLVRAASLAPGDAAIQHHLGRAYQIVGDLGRAAAAHAEAVRLEPAFFVARLSLGGCLLQLGHRLQSAIQYKRALDDAQAVGRWLDPSTTPEPLQSFVTQAVRVVRQSRRAVLDSLLAPLRLRYGSDSMYRVERCLRVYLSEEAAVYPDPRQRPSFLYFPDLPTSAFFDMSLFPWRESLEASTQEIRDELLRLLPSSAGSERVFESEALEAENLQGIDRPPSWHGYYFFRHGVRRDEACRASPRTTKVLDTLPLSRIRDHGPEVMFSVLTAGTHLKRHRGVTNTRSVGHLPLIVPPDCALNVSGEVHEWREGRAVVFDDTYEHEAWNRSVNTRVVLIFDIWNPHLSEAERAAVTDIVSAIGDFRLAVQNADANLGG